MMRGAWHALALSAAAALLGCADLQQVVAPAQTTDTATLPAPIDAAAVRALYAAPHREDGTVMHGSHEGAQWTKWTKPDGSLELLAGHGLFADTGRFVIRGNALCSTWGHIDGSKEHCVHLVQIGPDEYVTYGDDREEGSRFKVRPP
jgi:hypothetical protein